MNLVLPARTTSPAESPDAQAASRADVITVCLAYLLALLPAVHVAPADVAVLARQISLALVGAIILSSIRLVLRGVARVSCAYPLFKAREPHADDRASAGPPRDEPQPRRVAYAAHPRAAYGAPTESFAMRCD